jgi:hypothetical protein
MKKNDMIVIDIDIMITKTDTIISEIEITYVYDLTHACIAFHGLVSVMISLIYAECHIQGLYAECH